MKFIKAFVSVFIFTLLLSFTPTFVYSQDKDPIPPNTSIACNKVDEPEFHSLRPYQKNSECQSATSDYASFCGNTLTLQENIDVTYKPGVDDCSTPSNGKVHCNYTISVPADPKVPNRITIDLSSANLPIMGNTEEVYNSQNLLDPEGNGSNNIPPEQRVNNYVSWYLNGIFGRAEYNFPPVESGDGIPSIPDFSGPINKLLPQEVQQQKRALTVTNAGDTRHNQIVGCTFGINIFGITEIGGIPTPCYIKGLTDNPIYNNYVIPKRLSDWEGHLPPVRSDYSSYADYYIKYQEWRGKMCFPVKIPERIPIIGIKVPVIGGKTIILCGEDPLSPNYYSNLYQYIPLSSTEDLEGNIKVNSVSAGGAGVTNISFDNQSPATLFFSHIQESDELGSILQDTYISKDQQKKEKTGPDTAVSFPSSCTTVDVRSNKGDSLFAGSISGNLSYTASFSCDFDYLYCSTENNKDCAYGCIPDISGGTCIMYGQTRPETVPQKCSKTINIALSTQSNTPKIDDVWSRLVGGPTAVVKRMFPKLGTQIGTLKDIPGSTSITYNGAASSGELNLPHIGGISEYFLKGIQTLLRPKGYGEPISFGETTATLGGNCDGSVFEKYNPPSQTIDKATDYFNAYIKPDLTDEVVSVYREAEKQTGIPCEVFAGLHYIEGGNKPNSSLISGRPLGTPEPDEGNRVFTTLLDTAIYVAGRIKDKVGGDVSTWEKLVTALSRYNGGGNRNCQPNFSGGDIPYLDLPGRCPPSYEGEDDPYALSWIDKKHSQMYLLYCADFTACPPQELIRPGIMTVATDFYLAKKKGW